MTRREEAEPGALVKAAEAIEEELRKVEAAARAVQAAPLDSEKRLRQAAARLAELQGADERLRVPLQALSEAMAALVERQRAVGEALAERAAEIVEKRRVLDVLLGQYRELGAAAAKLDASVRDATDVDMGQVAGTLEALAGAAGALSRAAREQGFPALADEVHGLGQQLQSMRHRLAQLPSAPGPMAS